jgi:heptosyltransferase III
MAKENCAVFSCMGLGDGLIALVLSENLRRNGHAVTTFHPFLQHLGEWFPNHSISPFPPLEEISQQLSAFDKFYIFFEKSPWMQQILLYCQNQFPERTMVLNPIATPNRDYPYWEVGQFDGRKPFVENLYLFCKDILKLEQTTKSNGVQLPDEIFPRRHLDRVVIHPMSSREGKNWPKSKYVSLAKELKEKGFRPVFILTSAEKKQWEGYDIDAPDFANINEMAAFVSESGYMIGNDSGIGHLSSCFGLPTLILMRSQMAADFWRPSWSPGIVVTPFSWIPNIKGLRLRDRHWKRWISVERVLSSFSRLIKETSVPVWKG